MRKEVKIERRRIRKERYYIEYGKDIEETNMVLTMLYMLPIAIIMGIVLGIVLNL